MAKNRYKITENIFNPQLLIDHGFDVESYPGLHMVKKL